MIELITLATVALDRSEEDEYEFCWGVIEEAIPPECPPLLRQLSIKSCAYNEKERPSMSLILSKLKPLYQNDKQPLPPLSKSLCLDPTLLNAPKPRRATRLGELQEYSSSKKRERPVSILLSSPPSSSSPNPPSLHNHPHPANNTNTAPNPNKEEKKEIKKEIKKEVKKEVKKEIKKEVKKGGSSSNSKVVSLSKSDSCYSEGSLVPKGRKEAMSVSINSADGSGTFLVEKELYESTISPHNNKANLKETCYRSSFANEEDQLTVQINNSLVFPGSYLIITLLFSSRDKQAHFKVKKLVVRLFAGEKQTNSNEQALSELKLSEGSVFVSNTNTFYMAYKLPSNLLEKGEERKKYRMLVLAYPKKGEYEEVVNVEIQLTVVSDPYSIYKTSPTQVFFTPLGVVNLRESLRIPRLITHSIDYFHENLHLFMDKLNLSKPSHPPTEYEVNWLISLYDAGKQVQLSSIQSPYSLIEVTKRFLDSMPEPICSFSLYKPFLKVAGHASIEKRLEYYKKVFETMEECRSLLAHKLLHFFSDLYLLSSPHSSNKGFVIWGSNTQLSLYPPIVDLFLSPSSFLRKDNSSKPLLSGEDSILVSQILNDLICNYQHFLLLK